MNKADLVQAVAEKTGVPKKDVTAVVDACFASIQDALASGEDVRLVGFGTFEVKERAERTGRNPKTKEAITIPTTKAPSFKAGKALKDAVAK